MTQLLERRIGPLFEELGQGFAGGLVEFEMSAADFAGRIVSSLFDSPGVEAYATFNMGAGFAVYVSPADVAATMSAARECKIGAWVAGALRRDSGRKAVEIVPLGIKYDEESLQIR